MSITTLLLRLGLSFIVLFLLTRIMGRKEISQMTFFNFVSAISIGTIGASLAIDSSISMRNGLLALFGWAIFTLLLGWLNIKSEAARKIISGQPVIVIKDGKIMEEQLKTMRLDMESLNSLLRENNVFSLKDVDYAIFETDGKLSVLKKQEKQPLVQKDFNKQPSKQKIFPIPTSVITDGQVLTGNLEKLDIDCKWLDQQLQMAGVQSYDDVFYAEVQEDGSLHVDYTGEELK
ncbi:DUF421 domain-containing protein [Aciduricibacillus chroicocephali]|uniref:DUF421 domain-containing protein n=1 Tax=Aciduricibacillus chroicocephali TaxID=3054939 RepID=A0ABY9KX33_9BACI|nr:DUF421 domain-containing protein [Bacillaceae bacterium 44XB]